MKKKDLVSRVAASFGISNAESGRYLETVLGEISSALGRGEAVDLSGFGRFEVRRREARQGRNPRTGETLQIAAKNVPAFKASKALKDVV